jgi:hypothetical protein
MVQAASELDETFDHFRFGTGRKRDGHWLLRPWS